MVCAIIYKLNIFPNKQTFHIHVTIIKIKKIHKKIHLSLKLKKKKNIYIYIYILRKYNCMSKIFPKINLNFYTNVTTHKKFLGSPEGLLKWSSQPMK